MTDRNLAKSFEQGAAFSAKRTETISRHRALKDALIPWCEDIQAQARQANIVLTCDANVAETVDPKDVGVEISFTRDSWLRGKTHTLLINIQGEKRGLYDYMITSSDRRIPICDFVSFRKGGDEANRDSVGALKEYLTELLYKKILNEREFARTEGARPLSVPD